ncbi:MAG: hypothetical protein PHO74_04635 [Weeksellaceae bacterium]|nr:hypothetical protein [Weeksellaceae bacterium]
MNEQNENLESQFRYADELIANEQYNEAKDALFKIIEDEPRFGKAYNHIGWIYETKEKRYREAEKFYKQAMEFSPDYPAAYMNYIYLLNTELRGPESEAMIMKAKDIIGINKISLWGEWAYMLEYSGRFEQAIAKYKEIIPMQNNADKLEQIRKDIERCRTKQEMQEL